MTDQKSSVAQNAFNYVAGGSPRHFNVDVSQSPLHRIQDSNYFFSDRKLSQLFNVDAWTKEMDDEDNDLNDDTREPPPEPAPRGSYCPPSPGTPIAHPAPVEFGIQYGSGEGNGTFQNFSDDMALGMSRLSKISCDSSLTGSSDRLSINDRFNCSSRLDDDSTPLAVSPSHRSSTRFSNLSGFTLNAKSNRSSRASSSLPSILSDIICDSSHGIEDLFTDEDDLSSPHLLQWRDSVNGSDINWQERCMQLEISLQRFRERAAKIRDILKEKVTDLEQKVRDAETKAEHAEQKARVMERQLSQGSPCSNRRRPEINVEKSHSLNTSLCEDSISNNVSNDILTSLAIQKQLRMEDAKKVEAKAAKIKEWVRNKLRDLEDQNTILREQNAKCNIQLELLRGRLAHLSTYHNDKDKERVSSRVSLECDSRSHDDLPARIQQEHIYIPSRPATLGRSPRSKPRSPGSLRRVSSSDTDTHFNPLQSNFKRNINLDCDKRTSKSSQIESSSVDLETPQSLSPKTPLETMLNSLALSTHSTHSLPKKLTPTVAPKPVAQPRTKLQTSETSVVSKSAGSLELDLRSSHSKSKSSDSSQYDNSQLSDTSLPRAKDELHDYSEIYTPNDEVLHWQNDTIISENPPTPPLHRFPSWESRIYQLAQQGLCGGEMGSAIELIRHSSSLGSYPELHVPVYAAVKGRASQIRSVPFSGDSSDSSDGEDHCIASGTNDLIHGTGNSFHTPSSNESSSSSPSKSKTCSLSPAKRSASPFKVTPRDISFESAVSDDYAIPPDARSDSLSLDSTQASTASARTSCVETLTNTLSNSHFGLVSPRLDVALEKSGHLTKLGGKLKSWKKRYFVLKDGSLCYWKTQTDSLRKSAAKISLHDGCVVSRSEGSHTFEINTGKKTYYLSAENTTVVEDWVKVLQNVLRRNATKLLLSKEDNKPTVQGWLNKVKNGHGKQCWCVLIGKMFIYFRNPSDQNPLGQINMRDTKVEEVDKMSDSDEENLDEDIQKEDLTIGLLPDHNGPTYLICPNKQEKDSWLYHLTIVSGGTGNIGSEYEQLIQKLMELNGDPNCVLWRHPFLLHSKEQMTSSFTTLSSDQIKAEAVKLFKSCQLFTSVLMDSSAIDYHIVLCQNALQLCLSSPELQTELFCGLIKLTSVHLKSGTQVTKTLNKIKNRNLLTCATQSLILPDGLGSHKGSSQRIYIDPKINPAHFTFIQGWQLLSLAASLFVPKNNKLLWYLKAHLQRNADTTTEIGKYAIYCQRALERTILNGAREAKPSRMEVLSILLKNPYHHSLPHAIPVHFLNGTYQVVGFDGSTNIGEFVSSLNQEIGCRNDFQSGFALFSDDPIEKDLEHCMSHSAKLCDVISKWETALREKGYGKFENTKVIRLLFKSRLYWKAFAKHETEKEKLLLCYQVNEQIQQYKYPVNRELALEFATLMAQIDMTEANTERLRGSGSVGPSLSHVQQVFNKFYSLKFKEDLKDDEKKLLLETLQEKWNSLKGRSQSDCLRIFLTCARKWAYFGAVLFPATTIFPDCPVGSTSGVKCIPVWVAVNEEGVTLLEKISMQPIVRYNYENIVTFGGCQQDFMLVVHTIDGESNAHPPGTHKLMLSMNKPKILELTLLIADYMNALGQGVPGCQPAGTLTRNGSIRGQPLHQLPGQPDLVQMTSDIDRKDHRKKSSLERVVV